MSQVRHPLQISRCSEEPAITHPLMIQESYSANILFQLRVKGATHSQFSKELELWETTFKFLNTEYIDLLVFFKASGHLKGSADEIEKALNPARLAVVSRIISALIYMRIKPLEFPHSQFAVAALETAYNEWDKFENSLFVLIWKLFKKSDSP
ncbi:uncharacterized protein H6S33_001949 [Morchella sextelata]|uniref:uncharacterized protein n=1 Tax=Morchella sextelata TaxID=1174677 RepID=UPI001D047D73|nr:uncharacterized protein H6S33_001949 [Morchella sextelata]KAH0607897.1 hypothetical protein H6S33_001949 [Morchella sextelata]